MNVRVWLLVLAGMLSACEHVPVAPTETGHVSASLQGSIATTYEGSGQFGVGSARAPQRPVLFTLRSLGRAGDQGFYLQRPGRELPEVGEHALGQAGGFAAAYERVHEGVRERYLARRGVLEITVATPERLEGTFRFTAVRTCTGTGSALHCTVPAPDDAPTIEVAGTFVAVRGAGVAGP